MRWLLLSLALLFAVPAAAQPRPEQAPSGGTSRVETSDQTRVPSFAPSFAPAVGGQHGLTGISVAPVTPPPPLATWTFGAPFTAHCSERTYPYCDAVSTASCSGSACPSGSSSCSFYCNTSLAGAGTCPAAGSVSSTGPGAMGLTFSNTCGG